LIDKCGVEELSPDADVITMSSEVERLDGFSRNRICEEILSCLAGSDPEI
jgi:hypothetical protein